MSTGEMIAGALTDLRPMAAFVVMAMLLTMVAMAVDLCFGWRKAKERGDAHSSYAFSRTITKFVLYEGCLLIGSCVDTLVHYVWPMLGMDIDYKVPLFTFFLAIVLCCTELWSMREKADEKTRNRINDVSEMIAKSIGKDRLAKMIAEAVKKEHSEKEEKL